MSKKVLSTLAVLALSATMACAELVGSLHLTDDDANSVTNITSVAGLPTRTSDGMANTRGTVEGSISILASSDPLTTGSYDGVDLKGWFTSTALADLNRFGGNESGGILVWDYDLSGIVTNAWDLKIGYTRSRGTDASDVYISFNGMGRTLDTTVITNLTPGEAGALVSDPKKYIKIGSLPAATAEGTNVWDVTEIVTNAIANGGIIRLVYQDHTFKETVNFLEDSGLIATNTAAGVPVNDIPSFYLLDTFDTDTGLVPLNGWTEGGPEPKEYNDPINGPGILSIRDLNNDERGTTNSQHAGFFDTVTYPLNQGVTLADTNDWLQLLVDLGPFQDTSGAPLPDGRRLRVSLIDSTAANNAGFGFMLQTGTNSNWSQLHQFNGPTGVGENLGGANFAHPLDGTLAPMSLNVTKVAGGYEVSGFWGTGSWAPMVVSDSLAQTFDTLTISCGGYDFAVNIDNVCIVSNVEPPPLTAYQTWAISFGLTDEDALSSADPDLDDENNLYEWATGGDPTNSLVQGIAPAFGIAPVEGTNVFTYVFPSNPEADDLVYFIETTEDLVSGNWTNEGYEVGTGIHPENAAFNAVTNQVSTEGRDHQSVRLVIEQP